MRRHLYGPVFVQCHRVADISDNMRARFSANVHGITCLVLLREFVVVTAQVNCSAITVQYLTLDNCCDRFNGDS